MDYWWPILLVVGCNAIYQVCSKSIPTDASPFLALGLTYGVACLLSLAVYTLMNGVSSIVGDAHRLNWASIALGLVVVGLEFGFMNAYRAGWTVSTAATVQGAILAAVLVCVGYLAFHEPVTSTKVIGIVVCLLGIYLINR